MHVNLQVFTFWETYKKDSVCLHLPHLLLNGRANGTAQNVANAAFINMKIISVFICIMITLATPCNCGVTFSVFVGVMSQIHRMTPKGRITNLKKHRGS